MRPRPVSVPVIMQTNAAESGAACLGMLLAYYGLWIPLEQLRNDCGVGREEPGMENLQRVAEGRGLTVQTHQLTGNSLEDIPVPCLLERQDEGCVVLRGVSRRHVWLNDPAVGALRRTKEQFLSSFGTQAVQFTPGPGFQMGGSPTTVSSFLRSRLHGSFAPVLFVLLSGLAVGAASPAFGRVFLDRILSRRNSEWLTPFLLILAAITAAGILASLLQVVYLLKLKGKLAVVGNSVFFWHLLRLPISFFQQHLAGDLALRQILGFETPQKGAVYCDRNDIAKLDMKSYRRHIGVVLQDGKLFAGDIYSNIVITDPALTMEDAWEAAEIAGIADDIRAMPMGIAPPSVRVPVASPEDSGSG